MFRCQYSEPSWLTKYTLLFGSGYAIRAVDFLEATVKRNKNLFYRSGSQSRLI